MRVVVVSGIWPPDVGGPASHAPALAAALREAGHEVVAVTTADAAPADQPYRVEWVRRGLPAPVRHLAVARAVARAARGADVVYATTMIRRASLGARVARRPLVAKLVADEAYERERRSGRFGGTLAEFQELPGGARVRALRATRTAALRRARRVVVPSAYLREIALRWGLDPARVVVVPNPAPPLGDLPSREEAREALGLSGRVVATAGRLTAQKALGDALAAIARVDGASLVVLGDGPERPRLEALRDELGLGDRVRFLGAGTRDDVVRLFRAADVALLTSAWENLPHTVLEALAAGTPVVATAVGGVPEVVREGENGLLVAAGDVEAIAGALARLLGDDALRERLAAGGGPLRGGALRAAYPQPDRGGDRGSGVVRPRVLMVGRTRYRLPLDPSLGRKFEALAARLRLRVLGAAPRGASAGDGTFALQRGTPIAALDAPAFYGTLPLRIARELRREPADAILAQSPYEALAAFAGRTLARSDAPVVVEIHGDWRTWARLYGSPARAVVAPLADRAALVAVRHADAVRTLSPFTTRMVREAGVEPAGTFTTYTDLSAFSEPPVAPLPEEPVALYVGVLERYKNIHTVADAWRLAAPRVPGARLRLVGDGRHVDVVEALVRDLPGQTTWERRLETPDVVRALDDAWLLLLASRSEGTPRVVLEALCRGRAVVGARAGGIPDVVWPDETGLLADPDRPDEIADALVRILSDRDLAQRLGDGGHARSADWTYTADEYAERVAELVDRAMAAHS